MFSNIRSQLLALAALVALSFIAVGVITFRAEQQLDAALTEAEGAAIAIRNHLQADMLHDNLRGLSEIYVNAAKENKPTQLKEAGDELAANSQAIVNEFVKNKTNGALSEDIRAEVARIEPMLQRYSKAASNLSKVPAADTVALANTRSEVEDLFKKLEKELGGVREKIEQSVKDTRARAELTADNAKQLTAVAFAVALLLIGALLFIVYRSITRNIEVISDTIQKVNAGDLKARTELQVKNELGTLGRAFDGLLDERIATLERASRENEQLNNNVIELLQAVFQLGNRDLTVRAPVTEDVIGTVASSINQLTEQTSVTLADVQQIAQQVQQTSASVNQQAALVEETVKQEKLSLDRMTSNLMQATKQLTEVASLSANTNLTAQKASSATQQALDAVDGTVKGMDNLRESISEMEKRFKRLGERSQEISIAVGLINTISERTHVLALNASMQAATAGEAGRGFVVVAEEVQRLSDSSRQATAQISQLVGNIQAETNETLFTVNRLISQVVQQSELAQRAGTQMTQTQETTAQLVGLVQQIAAFSKQQAELASTLQKSVLDINKGTEQTEMAIVQQSQNTKTLAEYSRRLTESVGQFKLAA